MEEPHVYRAVGSPGHRAPNGNVDPFGGTVYDRIGAHPALLVLGEDSALVADFEKAAADRGTEVEVLFLPDPEVLAAYGAPYVLVRPDHHVAWRGDGTAVDAGAVLDRILGREPALAAPDTTRRPAGCIHDGALTPSATLSNR